MAIASPAKPKVAGPTPQNPFQMTPQLPGATSTSAIMGAQGPLVAGYNSAMQNFLQAYNLSGQTTAGGETALRQQYQNQVGKIGSDLTKRGLYGTSLPTTMGQAPLRSYNAGMAELQNQSAMRQMQALQAMGGMAAQGGMAQSNMMAPYAQSMYGQNVQSTQNRQALQLQAQQNAAAQQQAGINSMNQMGVPQSQQGGASPQQQYQRDLAAWQAQGQMPQGQPMQQPAFQQPAAPSYDYYNQAMQPQQMGPQQTPQQLSYDDMSALNYALYGQNGGY